MLHGHKLDGLWLHHMKVISSHGSKFLPCHATTTTTLPRAWVTSPGSAPTRAVARATAESAGATATVATAAAATATVIEDPVVDRARELGQAFQGHFFRDNWGVESIESIFIIHIFFRLVDSTPQVPQTICRE